MGKLKIGIIGLGNIGRLHLQNLATIENVELVAVCDMNEEAAQTYATLYHVQAYSSHIEMLDTSGVEAIIIAVPHFQHVQIACEAFSRGIHVLCEKPIAVTVNEALKINQAYDQAQKQYPDLVFAMMFQERTWPVYAKIAEIVQSGELGRLTRATWIITALFRTQAYYDSGGWRATWKGEGGGLLINQCSHNLDYYQWIFGLPTKISGKASFGKYHNIEVEDEVFAYFEHEHGMVGHFIATTGESPGTNRIEIVGEHGKLIAENSKLIYEKNKNSISTLNFLKESKSGFDNVETERIEISLEPQPEFAESHKRVTQAFTNHILTRDEALIAKGIEGINSVYLSNGILLSSMTGQVIETPFDGDHFDKLLKKLIENSERSA